MSDLILARGRSSSMGTRLYANSDSYPISYGTIPASGEQEETLAKGVGRVLVVDDNVDLANLAEMLLTVHGLEAIVAYSGDEALDVLAAHPEINAVVADVVMPGMNGIELADQISERYPAVKIVFVSGFISPAVSNGQALKHTLLSKPYQIEHLIRLLQSPI